MHNCFAYNALLPVKFIAIMLVISKKYSKLICYNVSFKSIYEHFHVWGVLFQLAKTQGNVFATDSILSVLMCCTRSAYSWDVLVQKIGKKLFLDKRDDSDSGRFTLIDDIVFIYRCLCVDEAFRIYFSRVSTRVGSFAFTEDGSHRKVRLWSSFINLLD